jgi:hypothetical protein
MNGMPPWDRLDPILSIAFILSGVLDSRVGHAASPSTKSGCFRIPWAETARPAGLGEREDNLSPPPGRHFRLSRLPKRTNVTPAKDTQL